MILKKNKLDKGHGSDWVKTKTNVNITLIQLQKPNVIKVELNY